MGWGRGSNWQRPAEESQPAGSPALSFPTSDCETLPFLHFDRWKVKKWVPRKFVTNLPLKETPVHGVQVPLRSSPHPLSLPSPPPGWLENWAVIKDHQLQRALHQAGLGLIDSKSVSAGSGLNYSKTGPNSNLQFNYALVHYRFWSNWCKERDIPFTCKANRSWGEILCPEASGSSCIIWVAPPHPHPDVSGGR